MSDQVSAGGVSYKFSADSTPLRADVQKTQEAFRQASNGAKEMANQTSQHFQKIEQSSRTMSTTVATAFGTALGNAVPRLIGAMVQSIPNAINKLADFGRQAEETRLSVDQLLSLKLAGAMKGLGTEEVDAALKVFTEQTKKTKDESKDLYKALSNIGEGFASSFSKARSQADALRVVADAMRSARGEVQRTQLAQQAFGTDSERLIKLFADGRVGLNGYEEAARSAGVTLDKGLVQKAEEARAKAEAFAIVLQVKLVAAFGQLLPAINAAADALPRFIDAASVGLAKFGGINVMTDNALGAEFQRKLAVLEQAKKAMAENDPATHGTTFWGNDTGQVDSKFSEATTTLQGEVDALKAEIMRRAKPFGENGQTGTEWLRGGASNDNEADRFKQRPQLNPPLNAVQRYIQSLDAETVKLKSEADAYSLSDQKKQEAINLTQLEITAKQNHLTVTEAQRKKVIELSDAYMQQKKRLQELENLSGAASTLGGDLLNTFEQMAFYGTKASDAVRNLSMSIADLVLKGALLNTGPLAFLFGQSSTSNGILGDMLKSVIAGFRADGGPVRAGEAYVVGERGPELYVANSSGTIVPNNKLKTTGASARGQDGSAQSITNHFYVTSPNPSSFAQSEQQITAMLNRAVRRGARSS